MQPARGKSFYFQYHPSNDDQKRYTDEKQGCEFSRGSKPQA
jgi:hypothetical protein